MFLDPESFPALATLAATLRAKASALTDEAVRAIGCFSPSPERYIMDPDDVRLYILPVRWQGKAIDQAALAEDDYRSWKPSVSPATLLERAPLLSALTDHPLVVSAMYSCSMPGCEIVPHIDRESAIGEVYRLHLGLHCPIGDCALVVGGERREWANGEILLFDSARVEHSAHNKTDRPRMIAIIDLDRAALDASRLV